MKYVERIQHKSIELEKQNLELQRKLELIRVEADLKLNEAHQVHNHALEQESAHENTIRLLCEDKETLNLDMIALAFERSAMEFQVSTDHNEVERLKASVQKLETDNMGLKFQLKEVMRQAKEQIYTQKQLAAMARDESRIEVQKMSAQVAHRDMQMNERHEQLQKLQQTITLQEERLRNEQYQYKRLQTKHEELRMELESLYSERHGLDDMMSNLLRERQPGMEEGDLIQKLERLICEMDRLAEEQCDKVMALQVDSDTKLAIEQQYSSDVQARLDEENAKLQQQVISDSLEKQQSQIVHVQRERDEQNRVVKDMEETIAALEVERLTQSSASDELQNLQAAKNELQTMYDRLKAEIMTQLAEKESEVTELEDNLTELQAKLDQEKEMSHHLMDRSSYDKQEQLKKSQELEAIVSDYQFKLQVNTEDEAQVKELEELVKKLQDRHQVSENTAVRRKKYHAREKELEEQVKLLERKLSAKSHEQQQQIEELEASVEQFRHELHISEQSIEAKELSAMHEKLHQERKYRSLPNQYDALVAENIARVTKLSAKR
ncbi:hypothetical protein PsorP6_006756 [Peronosclerospora sorghi]|uniref:Uncharacterized protein n=1 Tax=Peronosclerospora sorghi TaxID=230839 RepID=A0ACC0W691_9STRA|nr:hypothetical protein PsorP6_006756 [Peronosclerospora sorghi]